MDESTLVYFNPRAPQFIHRYLSVNLPNSTIYKGFTKNTEGAYVCGCTLVSYYISVKNLRLQKFFWRVRAPYYGVKMCNRTYARTCR